MPDKIQVLVCRIGQPPVVEYIEDDLGEMQRLVGGYVESIPLDKENGEFVMLSCNEEARLEGLPPNRPLTHYTKTVMLLGDFFIHRTRPDGALKSLTVEDLIIYKKELALNQGAILPC